MKKRLIILIICISLAALALLGILTIPNTGNPSGKAVLQYEDISVELTSEEASCIQQIFRHKHYNDGIGGCPFEKSISISFGETVYAIALDGCRCAKDWNKERYLELNESEYQQIAALFNKYCGETPIY